MYHILACRFRNRRNRRLVLSRQGTLSSFGQGARIQHTYLHQVQRQELPELSMVHQGLLSVQLHRWSGTRPYLAKQPTVDSDISAEHMVCPDAAFPCLRCADEHGTDADDVPCIQRSGDEQACGAATQSRVGSTQSLQGYETYMDYTENPRRRRGGAETGMSTPAPPTAGIPIPSNPHSSGDWRAITSSLPRGLTEQERLHVRKSIPPSPSATLLKEVNTEIVTSRTEHGRKHRRTLLDGSVLAFIATGYSGKRFVYEKASELGVKSVVLDAPDSWARRLEVEGKIAKFIPIDFTDPDTVFEQCLQGLRLATQQVGELDGITTFCELAVPLASRLAEKLGLPHNSPASVDAARDKFATREKLAQAGLPTPKHACISEAADLPKAGAHVGFPAVIKPVSGAASIGVIRVNNQQELQAAYDRVVSDMRKARVVACGCIYEGDPDVDDVTGNAEAWIPLTLMLEEYLDGAEVDVDLVFDEGQPTYGAVTDNWPTVEPYFNETGSNCPSVLPRAAQQELCEMAARSVQALGLQMGVFHVELKYTSKGARLIEVNCRMGGGCVRDTNLLVWGVDLVEEHLMTAVGIPSRPLVATRPLKHIGEYSINAKATGVLEHDRFMDQWQQHPDVLYARPLVQVQEAIQFVKQIEASLDIPIRPEPLAHHHTQHKSHSG